MSKRFIFLNSHPIQYFAPLYAKMAALTDVDLEVWYCSSQGAVPQKDRQFGQVLAWDIPILEGYRHRFFRNYALRPTLYSFWGLQNWGLVWQLVRAPKSTLVVNGWQFFINLVAIVVGRLAGHTVCIRGESPISRELVRSPKAQLLRQWVLGCGLFRFVHRFLYIGQQNRRFYLYMGIPEERLVFSPYCVDNQRFGSFLPKQGYEKGDLRKQLCLPEHDIVVLFSGKYIAKKRPMDLLAAWHRIPTEAVR